MHALTLRIDVFLAFNCIFFAVHRLSVQHICFERPEVTEVWLAGNAGPSSPCSGYDSDGRAEEDRELAWAAENGAARIGMRIRVLHSPTRTNGENVWLVARCELRDRAPFSKWTPHTHRS